MGCCHEGEELKWGEPSSLVYLVLPFISHDEDASVECRPKAWTVCG
jgi:hypothetical protein